MMGRPAKICFQFAGRTHGRELTGVHDRDAMAVLGLVEIVCRHQYRDAVARHLLDEPPELSARDRIDPSGRLVEKHDSRLMQDGAAEREALPPSAGKIFGLRVLPAGEARHLQDKFLPGSDAIVGKAVECAEESNVLRDRQRLVQRELLRHVADPPFDFLGILADVNTVNRDRAGRWPQQTAHHADRGRLSGAVGAKEAENLTTRDLKPDAIDGNKASELSRQVADDDGIVGRHHRPIARFRRAAAS